MKEMKKRETVLKLVGVTAIVLAIGGLWYNFAGLPTFLANREHDPEIPYFLPAFLIMSAICVVCYLLLILIGLQLMRGRLGVLPLFKGVLVFEVGYFLLVSLISWPIPKLGMSIAAAFGIANGGLMLQAFVLFPLWAVPAVRWAQRRIGESSNQALHGTADSRADASASVP